MSSPAYDILRDSLGLSADLPLTPDWSAAADFLELIQSCCMQHEPANIVECGSGASTLVLARCCQMNASGHVYSLEHGEQYAQQTRKHLHDFGLSEFVTVMHAPLVDHHIEAECFLWYDTSELPALKTDMLVIDGPPGFLQAHARYPALPVLFDRMSENCSVFMDDAARADERHIVQRWLQRYPVMQHEYIATERGCSVLTRA